MKGEEQRAGSYLGHPQECRNGFQFQSVGAAYRRTRTSGLFSSFGLKTLVYHHFLFLFPCSVLLQLLGDPHIKSAVNFMSKRKRGGWIRLTGLHSSNGTPSGFPLRLGQTNGLFVPIY